MRRLRTPLGLLLAAALLAPAPALAGSSEDYFAVFKAYKSAGDIDPCAFSAAKLASARKGVPPDIDTYAPDFADALDSALRQRASGTCDDKPAAATAVKRAKRGGAAAASPSTPASPGAAAAPTSPTATAAAAVPAAAGASGAAGAPADPTTTPAPAPEPSAAPAAADGSVAGAARDARATSADDAPLPLVLLAALAGLGLLAGLLWAVVRFFDIDPPWLAAGRHATAEAGWRASASWAEFADWVRLGR